MLLLSKVVGFEIFFISGRPMNRMKLFRQLPSRSDAGAAVLVGSSLILKRVHDRVRVVVCYIDASFIMPSA